MQRSNRLQPSYGTLSYNSKVTELTGAPLSRRDQVRLPLVLRLFCAHVRHQLLVKRLLNHLLRHVRHVPDQEDGLFAN